MVAESDGSCAMLRALLGLAALLGLSYVMADKQRIPEYTRRVNRVMLPWAIAAGIVLLLIIVI
jgi:hypothetical protein